MDLFQLTKLFGRRNANEEDNRDQENDQITNHLCTPYSIPLSISDDCSGIEKTDQELMSALQESFQSFSKVRLSSISNLSWKKHKKKKSKRGKSRNSKKRKSSGIDNKSSSKVMDPTGMASQPQHLATKSKKYEQLSMNEFCAEYAPFLEISDKRIQKYRLRHFKDLMYLASRYSWLSILSFHAACLYEIEHGTKKWGSSFRKLEATTLLAAPPPRKSTGKSGGEPILYCGAFQKDACSHTKDHKGLLRGESRMLKHICAHCWLSGKKFASHSQASCPSKTKEED